MLSARRALGDMLLLLVGARSTSPLDPATSPLSARQTGPAEDRRQVALTPAGGSAPLAASPAALALDDGVEDLGGDRRAGVQGDPQPVPLTVCVALGLVADESGDLEVVEPPLDAGPVLLEEVCGDARIVHAVGHRPAHDGRQAPREL
jgi:hypothetical protein